ncbi:Fur family transcriptional regulator [Flavobacterium sp. A45]|uniref:Fur family transcriptional regulator n=1 Tax=Flavobacterium sp. A45 TaxID=1945862 RepID=UPI000985B8E7|nr:Fur family transcriptional regulator [Flavobacterium sp. A45]OOG64717.1 Fur family transcriptional regulator [Flavobacterium sp. A45]
MKKTSYTIAKKDALELIMHSDAALSNSKTLKLTEDLRDKVTIYRTLDCLVNEDVIHKIATPDGIVKYTSCHHHHDKKHTHNHVHSSCENCLSITCLDSVKPTFVMPENYLVKQVNFSLSGLCPICRVTK